ncbi:MAG: CheR family methyltransferase, partial [Myxococcaceae bacterium]
DARPETARRPAPPAALDGDPELATQAADAFPVVGVGASAGGVEALEAFFGGLSQTGMAFVVVQHMASDKPSHLPEIIGRVTRMPVVQATDGLSVEPDHVYVVPPGSNLALLEGKLHLIELAPGWTHGGVLPVNFFFHSLAAECGARCMGVILSGTGMDGMHGLQDIRGAGGLTFAQEPATARFPGMPSAAAVGADAVLSPQGIAEELVRISRHPYLRGSIPPQNDEGRKKLFILIRSAFGTDLSFYKYATVQRRIERRMALNKIERLEDYVRLVQAHPEELKTLYRDLLINVTSFLRDGAPFEVLREVVLPRIIARKKPGDAIRIWVPGCASGEEAYSIGICLLETLGDRAGEFRLQIFATDLDDDAIARARAGYYPMAISTDMSPERLRRFFQRGENGYEVGRRLRELVVFATHDVTRDAPFSRLDMCSCRNVLIYLQTPLQRRVLRMLHYALGPEGFLMLGSSETVGDAPELFSVFDKKNRIYQKRSVASVGVFALDGVTPRDLRTPRTSQSDPLRPLANLQQLADRKVLERFGPAGVLVNEGLDILQFRGRTGLFLEPAPGTATLNLLKLARPELHVELRTATHRALEQNVPTAARNIQLQIGDRLRPVSIEVHPLRDPETSLRSLLVLFRAEENGEGNGEEPAPEPQEGDVGRTEALERELASTKEYLQSTIEELETSNEELKSANEELQSSNEELQSTNEELETSKEELQSTNEELTTVNDEVQRRMEELSVSNDDLINLLGAVDGPVLMVGMDLRLRRLTEAAERTFGLSAEDLNRPVSILKPFLPTVELDRVCRQVIDRLTPVMQEVQAADGRWFDLRVRPYRTVDHVIGGAVVSLAEVHRSPARLDPDQLAPLSVLPTAVLVLDERQRVTWANDAAAALLGAGKATLLGVELQRLGAGQLAAPELLAALERLARDGERFASLPLALDGKGRLLVTGARLPPGDKGEQRLLLFVSDTPERSP